MNGMTSPITGKRAPITWEVNRSCNLLQAAAAAFTTTFAGWVYNVGTWVAHVFFFFFFQAEDGIRDWSVTGVQTCALPIFRAGRGERSGHREEHDALAS